MGIGWRTLNNQAKQDDSKKREFPDKFFNERPDTINNILIDPFKEKYPFLNTSYINEILHKYGLKEPSYLTNDVFKEHIQKLFERLPLWHHVIRAIDATKDEKTMIETAIIAAAIKDTARKEYCFLSSPLEASVRSEGIALTTATLIQGKGTIQNLKKILEKGAKTYSAELKETNPENKEIDVKPTMRHLNLLIEQDRHTAIPARLDSTLHKSRGFDLEQ